MKKSDSGSKSSNRPVSSAAKELFEKEEQVLFTFFRTDIKKRHFFSIASILFSLSIGLFIIKRLGAAKLSWNIVLSFLVISYALVYLIVKYRMAKQHEQRNVFVMLERILPLYTIALLFTVLYLVANYMLGDGLLRFRDLVFLMSLATIFETITYHVH